MTLDSVFSPECVCLNLESSDKDELFEEMVQLMVTAHPEIDRAKALEALIERESKMSTGIMHGIAVPHGNCNNVKGVVGGIGISKAGVDYDALDKSPVHLVFMLLCNPDETELHLNVLKDLAAILQNPSFVKEVMEKTSGKEVYELLHQYESMLVN